MSDLPHPYVSRGGVKLAAALDAFDLDVAGMTCADLGCSVGGFTDVLLQRGAARVFAVDTAYGQLAWTLRNDPRVVVMERANALHVEPQAPCDLVVVDLGWTKQDKAVPAALRWLRRDGRAYVITLVKPHYEGDGGESEPTPGKGKGRGKRFRGRGPREAKHVLTQAEADAVTQRVLADLPRLGVDVVAHIRSPITGGKGGNIEHLALLTPTP